ncbi:MAG: pilus assembly protein [Actinobacteria bacterium]|nr:pilus assembly protein [Actinomycetota bacterium]
MTAAGRDFHGGGAQESARWLGTRRGRRREDGGDERGDALTEMVIATPVLIMFISAVMQVVLWGHATHVAQAAAAEGARAARVAEGTEAAARERAAAFLRQAGADMVLDPVVDVALDDRRARVEIRGRAPQLVPFLRPAVHAVAEGPTERFRSPRE